MRTAHPSSHASHSSHAHARTVEAPRKRRGGLTLAGLIGGLVGAFLGLFIGYAAGIVAAYLIHPPVGNGILPPPTLWEALADPGDFGAYTPVSILLGFVLCGWLGEKAGRQIGRATRRSRP